MLELFDRKPTRNPASRSCATPPAAAGIGSSPRQMTPSRSKQTTGAVVDRHPASSTARAERVPVVGLIGAHGDGELEVAAGTEAVTLPQEAESEAEVGVVVHRVDLHRARELGARGGKSAGPEVRASERLAHRRLVGLEVAGALQGDDRRVRVLRLEEPGSLLECLVRRFHSVSLSSRPFRQGRDGRAIIRVRPDTRS